MNGLRFNLTRSKRLCYRGHTNTYKIEGADEASKMWLSNWDLYCHTCKALTCDLGQAHATLQHLKRKQVIGFVTAVPLDLKIIREDEDR